MPRPLEQAVVAITGASSGVGRAMGDAVLASSGDAP